MSLQFAKLAGAEVIAVDRLEGQLGLARELGADHIVPAVELEAFVSKTGKPDVVMVHAPSQQAVDQAMKAVKRGGTVLMAVIGNVNVAFYEEPTVVGSVIGSRMDMNETLNLASKRKVVVKWQAFKLEEANEVLLKLKRGEIVGRAVLTP
jgi:propanol-preferring alcohol dehydrogenase